MDKQIGGKSLGTGSQILFQCTEILKFSFIWKLFFFSFFFCDTDGILRRYKIRMHKCWFLCEFRKVSPTRQMTLKVFMSSFVFMCSLFCLCVHNQKSKKPSDTSKCNTITPDVNFKFKHFDKRLAQIHIQCIKGNRQVLLFQQLHLWASQSISELHLRGHIAQAWAS